MTKKKGFTLIELLVVIAIIGLLSTLAVVALNSARRRARDAKRVADIKQVQTALELYYNDQDEYPTGTTLALGEVDGNASCTTDCLCLGSTAGFAATCDGTVYMGLIPANPSPNGADYVYSGLDDDELACAGGGDCSDYDLTFEIEGSVGSLSVGARTASPEGIK